MVSKSCFRPGYANEVELEQASRAPGTMTRRPSTRPSVATRPVSSFRPSSQISPTTSNNQALVALSYSPPFALSSTPPFAIPESIRRSSTTLTRTPSISHMNAFPPQPTGYSYDAYHRYGSSPSSYQTGTALARALTSTAMRLIGSSANSAATALVRATSKGRPKITRTTDVDKEEDSLLKNVEDVARKAFVLFELADSRLVQWQQLGTATGPYASGNTPPYSSYRRKSSSSSANSELMVLRQQEAAAGEAVHLYVKAMTFITVGFQYIGSFVDQQRGYSDEPLSFNDLNPSPELVQSECRDLGMALGS
jgi:serine/threonine-protein kinase ULK/ATG1